MVQGTEEMVPEVTMTAKCDYWHSEFLLKHTPVIIRSFLNPNALEYVSEKSLDTLIKHVFWDLEDNCTYPAYMYEHAILSTRNEHVVRLNNARMINMFHGKSRCMSVRTGRGTSR
jgi:hypothetical protein